MNRTLASFLSVAFHPLLMLTYALLVLLAVNPFAFGVRSLGDPHAKAFLLQVLATTVVLPGLGVLLLKPLGMIKTMAMEDRMERIGPYIMTGVFYLWLFKNFLSLGQTPPLYSAFTLGATISLFLAFFINIFSKISAHAVGMGGLAAMIWLAASQWGGYALTLPLPGGGAIQFSLLALLALVVVVAGLVGAARLSLNAHEPIDVWRGYAVGIAGVLLASEFML